jgi:hypothetical protein
MDMEAFVKILFLSFLAITGADLLIWSQINFSRNIPLKIGDRVSFFDKNAMSIRKSQIFSELLCAILIALCNIYMEYPIYGFFITALIAYSLWHVIFVTYTYWNIFSAASINIYRN